MGEQPGAGTPLLALEPGTSWPGTGLGGPLCGDGGGEWKLALGLGAGELIYQEMLSANGGVARISLPGAPHLLPKPFF